MQLFSGSSCDLSLIWNKVSFRFLYLSFPVSGMHRVESPSTHTTSTPATFWLQPPAPTIASSRACRVTQKQFPSQTAVCEYHWNAFGTGLFNLIVRGSKAGLSVEVNIWTQNSQLCDLLLKMISSVALTQLFFQLNQYNGHEWFKGTNLYFNLFSSQVLKPTSLLVICDLLKLRLQWSPWVKVSLALLKEKSKKKNLFLVQI